MNFEDAAEIFLTYLVILSSTLKSLMHGHLQYAWLKIASLIISQHFRYTLYLFHHFLSLLKEFISTKQKSQGLVTGHWPS